MDLARAKGADLEKIVAACGLGGSDGAIVDDVSVSDFVRLLATASEQLNDPLFGLRVGRIMQPIHFAGYGLGLCACRTLRQTAAQTMRFESLSHDLARTELLEEGEMAFLRWRSPWQGLEGFRHVCDLVAAAFRSQSEWLVGMALPRAEVDFVHDAPSDATLDEYETLLGAKLRFGAPTFEARFPRIWLDLPVTNADTELFAELSRIAEQRLATRKRETNERPIIRATRERILERLSRGRPSLPEVAESLGLTKRSLQRRLADENVSFSNLLDEVRREIVPRYLREKELSLTEIAFLLGFSEQSTFNHTFRQWFSMTPNAWRSQISE